MCAKSSNRHPYFCNSDWKLAAVIHREAKIQSFAGGSLLFMFRLFSGGKTKMTCLVKTSLCFGINSGQKLNIFPFMNARLNGWMVVRTGTGGPGSCAVAVERFYASLYLYVCEYAFICAHTCLNIN